MRYIDNLTMDGITFNGYYYFDENGRMVTETGMHELKCHPMDRCFPEHIILAVRMVYFVQEAGTTPDGFPVDETGKVQELENLGIENLKPQLESVIQGTMAAGAFMSRIWKQERKLS